GLGEVGAPPGLGADRLDHGRMRVPGQGRPVAAVQVDVLVAVDVVDHAAAAVAQPDWLRHRDLPAGRDAAGQRAASPGRHPCGLRLPPQEDLLLLGDDVPELLVPGFALRALGAVLRAHGVGDVPDDVVRAGHGHLLSLTEHSV